MINDYWSICCKDNVVYVRKYILKPTYTRQLLSLATRQHYHSCMLHMKYRMVHSTSRLEKDRRSIPKQLVECSIRYFYAQHPQIIMLPCRQRQKLPMYGRLKTKSPYLNANYLEKQRSKDEKLRIHE